MKWFAAQGSIYIANAWCFGEQSLEVQDRAAPRLHPVAVAAMGRVARGDAVDG